MTNEKRALLGDYEAAKRLADAGILLPCPFCGGEAIVEYDTIEPFEYVVCCRNCGVMTTTNENKQVACIAWNTRAPILNESELKELKKLEETT